MHDDIWRSSAVSRALTYPALCLAAKNEEQRQAELKRIKTAVLEVRPNQGCMALTCHHTHLHQLQQLEVRWAKGRCRKMLVLEGPEPFV